MRQNESAVTHEQYLTFVIDGEEYALGILRVKEIIAYDTVTRVPRTASFIRGVINLRGSVVPVVDLAVKFGFREAPVTRSTCIVIVEVQIGSDHAVVGLIVDSVSHVVELAADEIEAPPQFGTLDTTFLTGMARAEGGRKFILLVDIDRVLSAAEGLQVLDASQEGQPDLAAATA